MVNHDPISDYVNYINHLCPNLLLGNDIGPGSNSYDFMISAKVLPWQSTIQ